MNNIIQFKRYETKVCKTCGFENSMKHHPQYCQSCRAPLKKGFKGSPDDIA